MPAGILKLRAHIANNDAKTALSEITPKDNTPDFLAVKALAKYALGKEEEAVSEIESLIETASEDATVQVLGGTVFQAVGKTEEALALLSKHQGNLEACV